MITKYRRTVSALLAATAIAAPFALTGCSTTGAGTAASDGKGLTVGVVSYDTTSLSAKAETDAASSEMKKEGWDVLSQDAKGQADQANSICTQYVTRHVGAIVVSVFTEDQMAQCMNGAKAQNIPVFYMAGSLTAGAAGAISTTVAEPINDVFIKKVKDIPNLKILAFTVQKGAPCLAREADLDKKLEANGLSGKIQKHEVPVPGQVTDAQAATQAWLTANPASNNSNLVIWSCFSDPAMGAYAAMQQVGRIVPAYTWDFSSSVVDPMRKGAIAAVLSIDSAGEGKQIVKMIKDNRTGGQPQQVDAASTVVTPETLDTFVSKNPDLAK